MIRFSCPQCGKALKVPGEKAGKTVACTRCGERSVAPVATAADKDEPARRSATPEPGPARGLFRGMSGRERLAVALVAGVAAGTLLLPTLSPLVPVPEGLADWVANWTVPLVAGSAVLLLAILHGHATGCPACGKWWAREEVEKGFVEAEGFDNGSVPSGVWLYRTTYQCGGCGHRWSVTDTEANRRPARTDTEPKSSSGDSRSVSSRR